MFSYTYTNLNNLIKFVISVGRGYQAQLLVVFAVLYFVLPITFAAETDKLTVKVDEDKGLKVLLFDGKGLVHERALILNSGRSITPYIKDGKFHDVTIKVIENGQATYTPVVRVEINKQSYFADARYLHFPNGESYFKKYEKDFLSDVNADLKRSNKAEVGTFPDSSSLYLTEAAKIDGFVRPKPRPENLTTNKTATETTGVDESKPSASASRSASSGSGSGTNSLGIDLMPGEVASGGTDSSAAKKPTEDKPKVAEKTSKQEEVPVPRPVPRPNRGDSRLSDAVVVANNKDKNKILVVTREMVDGKEVIKHTEESFDLKKGTSMRAVFWTKPVEKNGVLYQEVELVLGGDVNKRLLVPLDELVDSNGNTLKPDSVLTISGVAKKKKEDETKARAAKEKEKVAREAREKTQKDEESRTQAQTEEKKKEDDKREQAEESKKTEAKKKADEVATAKPGTCANPEYFNFLTGSNPNCKLVKNPALVRSNLKKGDAVIAMDKKSNACYKISVDTAAYVNNDTVDAFLKARKDHYDDVANKLQKYNRGFISQGQAHKEANRYNANCFDRITPKQCNFSLGTGADQQMNLAHTLVLPAKGYNEDASKDQKLEIYGPTSNGFYMVRHLNGHALGRSFLIQDRKAIEEAIQGIKDHEYMFGKKAFQDMMTKNPKSFVMQKPALDIQKMDKDGKVKNEMIYLDPKQPAKKIFELNQKYDYYSISCTESYNPLQPNSEEQGGVAKKKQTTEPEDAVLRGYVPRTKYSEGIEI